MFTTLRCPECARRGENPAPVLGEIMLTDHTLASARFKCRRCAKRIWVDISGHDVTFARVDVPRPTLVASA